MVNGKITDRDALAELNEAEKALGSLRELLMNLSFDPENTLSVGKAIHKMEVAVDSRVYPFRTNEMVLEMADRTKAKFRALLLSKAPL